MDTYIRDFNHKQIEHTRQKNNKLYRVYGLGLGGVFLLMLVGVFQFVRAQSQPTSVPLSPVVEAQAEAGQAPAQQLEETSNNSQYGSPSQPRVAGVSTAQAGEAESSFGVVSADSSSETSGQCQVGTVFMIGEKELSPANNPVDEFNWVGALDVVPDYTNPFVVGQNTAAQFPWRTSKSQPDTMHTVIEFTYNGGPATAQLELGWSPGKQGEMRKEVTLDGFSIGKTPLRQGELVSGNWENMPFYQENMPVQLTTGKHVLSIAHVSNDGGEAVWDYVGLHVTACK